MRWFLMVALALTFAAPVDAYAAKGGKGKGKSSKKEGKAPKGVKPAKIEKMGIDSIDKVFAQVKAIDKKIMGAQKKLDANRVNLATTMGLPKTTPVKKSLKELKKKSKGNLKVKMVPGKDGKGKKPQVSTKSNADANVMDSVEAVNQMTKDLTASIKILRTVPKDTTKLINRAKQMPAKLKTEMKGKPPMEIIKALGALKTNISSTVALPKKTKTLTEDMVEIMTAIKSLGE